MNTNSDSLDQNARLRWALGPYRLVREIGRGGMAAVFLAVFPSGDGSARPAVLKQLHPDLALDREFRAMFEDEARLATRLHHPNVVETYDVYSDPDLCVLVMEFLQGQTLSRIRQTAHRMGGLPLPIQLHCLSQVLAGLDYVHELTDEKGNSLSIVHRDVTPTNVFVTYRGEVKVVDFGIAKANTRLNETRAGVLKGKLGYMSPEAVRGEPVDRRSDIFSVGVMLWEAVTGRHLWQDHSDLTVFRRLAAGQLPTRPAGLAIFDPDAFAIAERALANDPNRRYATAGEMRRDIESLFAQQGASVGASALAGYMQSCFAEEGQKLEAIVDEALSWFRQPTPPPYVVVGSNVGDNATPLDASEPPTTVSIPPTPIARTATFRGILPIEPKRRRVPWLGMGLAAGAVGLAVSAALIAHKPSSALAKPAVAPPASAALATGPRDALPKGPRAPLAAAQPPLATAPTVVPLPAPAITPERSAVPVIDADLEIPRASIKLAFSANPPEARFFLDGERLEGNPVTLQRQPDEKRHRLRIEAPGYIPFSKSLDLDSDMTRVFDLVRKPPPPLRPAHTAEPAADAKAGCPKSRQEAEAAKDNN